MGKAGLEAFTKSAAGDPTSPNFEKNIFYFYVKQIKNIQKKIIKYKKLFIKKE